MVLPEAFETSVIQAGDSPFLVKLPIFLERKSWNAFFSNRNVPI